MDLRRVIDAQRRSVDADIPDEITKGSTFDNRLAHHQPQDLSRHLTNRRNNNQTYRPSFNNAYVARHNPNHFNRFTMFPPNRGNSYFGSPQRHSLPYFQNGRTPQYQEHKFLTCPISERYAGRLDSQVSSQSSSSFRGGRLPFNPTSRHAHHSGFKSSPNGGASKRTLEAESSNVSDSETRNKVKATLEGRDGRSDDLRNALNQNQSIRRSSSDENDLRHELSNRVVPVESTSPRVDHTPEIFVDEYERLKALPKDYDLSWEIKGNNNVPPVRVESESFRSSSAVSKSDIKLNLEPFTASDVLIAVNDQITTGSSLHSQSSSIRSGVIDVSKSLQKKTESDEPCSTLDVLMADNDELTMGSSFQISQSLGEEIPMPVVSCDDVEDVDGVPFTDDEPPLTGTCEIIKHGIFEDETSTKQHVDVPETSKLIVVNQMIGVIDAGEVEAESLTTVSVDESSKLVNPSSPSNVELSTEHVEDCVSHESNKIINGGSDVSVSIQESSEELEKESFDSRESTNQVPTVESVDAKLVETAQISDSTELEKIDDKDVTVQINVEDSLTSEHVETAIEDELKSNRDTQICVELSVDEKSTESESLSNKKAQETFGETKNKVESLNNDSKNSVEVEQDDPSDFIVLDDYSGDDMLKILDDDEEEKKFGEGEKPESNELKNVDSKEKIEETKVIGEIEEVDVTVEKRVRDEQSPVQQLPIDLDVAKVMEYAKSLMMDDSETVTIQKVITPLKGQKDGKKSSNEKKNDIAQKSKDIVKNEKVSASSSHKRSSEIRKRSRSRSMERKKRSNSKPSDRRGKSSKHDKSSPKEGSQRKSIEKGQRHESRIESNTSSSSKSTRRSSTERKESSRRDKSTRSPERRSNGSSKRTKSNEKNEIKKVEGEKEKSVYKNVKHRLDDLNQLELIKPIAKESVSTEIEGVKPPLRVKDRLGVIESSERVGVKDRLGGKVTDSTDEREVKRLRNVRDRLGDKVDDDCESTIDGMQSHDTIPSVCKVSESVDLKSSTSSTSKSPKKSGRSESREDRRGGESSHDRRRGRSRSYEKRRDESVEIKRRHEPRDRTSKDKHHRDKTSGKQRSTRDRDITTSSPSATVKRSLERHKNSLTGELPRKSPIDEIQVISGTTFKNPPPSLPLPVLSQPPPVIIRTQGVAFCNNCLVYDHSTDDCGVHGPPGTGTVLLRLQAPPPLYSTPPPTVPILMSQPPQPPALIMQSGADSNHQPSVVIPISGPHDRDEADKLHESKCDAFLRKIQSKPQLVIENVDVPVAPVEDNVPEDSERMRRRKEILSAIDFINKKRKRQQATKKPTLVIDIEDDDEDLVEDKPVEILKNHQKKVQKSLSRNAEIMKNVSLQSSTTSSYAKKRRESNRNSDSANGSKQIESTGKHDYLFEEEDENPPLARTTIDDRIRDQSVFGVEDKTSSNRRDSRNIQSKERDEEKKGKIIREQQENSEPSFIVKNPVIRSSYDKPPPLRNPFYSGSIEPVHKTCFECLEVGHMVRDCPYLKCKICGQFGHFASHCSTVVAQGSMINHSIDQPPPLITASTTSSSGSTPGINLTDLLKPWRKSDSNELIDQETTKEGVSGTGGISQQGSSLLHYIQAQLSMQGVSFESAVNTATECMEAWSRAQHDENSLVQLYWNKCKERMTLINKVQWRLILIEELGKVPAREIPLHVNISHLLTSSVTYFMNEDSSAKASLLRGHESDLQIVNENMQSGSNSLRLTSSDLSLDKRKTSKSLDECEEEDDDEEFHRQNMLDGIDEIEGIPPTPENKNVDKTVPELQEVHPIVKIPPIDVKSLLNIKSALTNVCSIEQLHAMNSLIERNLKADPAIYQCYLERLDTLKVFYSFLIEESRNRKTLHNILKAYNPDNTSCHATCLEVASMIQKLVAYVGFCTPSIKRKFALAGSSAFRSMMQAKLEPFKQFLPKFLTILDLVNLLYSFVRCVISGKSDSVLKS